MPTSRAKSAKRVELGKAAAAKTPRDPVTGGFVRRDWGALTRPKLAPPAVASIPPADPPPSPPPAPAGGDAPAPSPFRGRLLGRLRRQSR
jgi:hypothetical protein